MAPGFLLERVSSTRHGPLGERFDTYFVLILRCRLAPLAFGLSSLCCLTEASLGPP